MENKDKHNELPNHGNKNEADFDRFVRRVYEAEEALQRANPYEKELLKELTAKVNSFLQRHAEIDFNPHCSLWIVRA